MSKSIVVCAVHPDDETLGCGGTLLRHKALGDTIHWIILTRMSTSQGFSPEKIAARNLTIEQVGTKYGIDSCHQLNFNTTDLDTIPVGDLISTISAVFKETQPNVVYLPFKNDVHTDHQAAFTAIYSCTKVFRYPSIERILMMETLSETDFCPAIPSDYFTPNTFVDISEYLDKKNEIMSMYTMEIAPPPFPRNVENITHLAAYRGSQAGCQYAEAFMLIKEIIR